MRTQAVERPRARSPARTSGSIVSEYPKTNARTTESAIVAGLPSPAAVPITIPSTSPIAHPVRQWSVASAATRLSEAAVPLPMRKICAMCIPYQGI